MNKVYLVDAVRTPIGSFLGSLSGFSAAQLGSFVIKALVERNNINPESIDEVLMGNVLQAGIGQAPARQAVLLAGLPNTIPATTINKVCASGMKTIMQGAQAIALGDADIIIAGGMESMSNVPHYLQARVATKYGNTQLIDGLAHDGLTDPYHQCPMGFFADQTANKYSITREAQDEFAINSYKKAIKSTESNAFKNEIISISIPQRKGEPIIFEKDEECTQVQFDKIPQLKPVFTKDGTVTAANASTINDGAAAVLLMSEKMVNKLGIKTLAEIVSYADAAHEPENFTTAPSLALPKALEKAQLKKEEIDYVELNEAFSVVGLANIQIMKLDSNKVNIKGGAVALGHPLGCSGTRILVTLAHILQENKAKYGAAAICNGGGGASAMILKTT